MYHQSVNPIYEVNNLAVSFQQHSQHLKDYLIQLQQQSQTVLQQIQQLQEQQAVLQNSLNNDLSQFEQKASTGQGLQGLFNGNQMLKNEIMQKRVSLEKNVGQLRQATQQLLDKLNQLGGVIQQMEIIPNQFQQGIADLQNLEQELNAWIGSPMQFLNIQSQLPNCSLSRNINDRDEVLQTLERTSELLEHAARDLEKKQVFKQLVSQAEAHLQQWQQASR